MVLNWAVQKDMFPENEKRLEEILGDRLTYFDYRLEGPDCSLEPHSSVMAQYSPVEDYRSVEPSAGFMTTFLTVTTTCQNLENSPLITHTYTANMELFLYCWAL